MIFLLPRTERARGRVIFVQIMPGAKPCARIWNRQRYNLTPMPEGIARATFEARDRQSGATNRIAGDVLWHVLAVYYDRPTELLSAMKNGDIVRTARCEYRALIPNTNAGAA